jgi:CBS-domain-containing membrane protein
LFLCPVLHPLLNVDIVKEEEMRTWQVGDVMSTDVASVDSTATYREVVALIEERRINAVPVVDSFRRVLGVVTESDLLRKVEQPQPDHGLVFRPGRRAVLAKARAEIAADLMTSPAIVTYSATSVVHAAREMARARVKQLPVIDDLGRLVGIVSRGDLLRVHLRPDADVQRDVVDEVLHRILGVPDGQVAVEVTDGVVRLAGRLTRRSSVNLIEAMSTRVSGVVSVVSELRFDVDDTFMSELTA